MITLTVIFAILYLFSWYSFYVNDGDSIDMPLGWYAIWVVGTVLSFIMLCTMCVIYLP